MLEDVVRKDYRIFDKNENIGNALGYLYEEKHFPIIADNKKPWGILYESKFIKRKPLLNEKIENFSTPVPKIDATYSFSKAKAKMKESRKTYAIVMFEKKLMGYIKGIDVLYENRMKKAGDIARYVELLSPNDTVSNALKYMQKNKMAFIPVVENEKFIGILHVRDIIGLEITGEKYRGYHTEKINTMKLPISGFMERGIRTVGVEDTENIIKIVDKQGFAVVVEKNKYYGVIEQMELMG